MVVGTVRILPLAARREQVLEILRSVQGPVRAQPGCDACDIYEEQGGERAIVLIERFDSDEALQAHLRSDNYWRVLGALELSQGEPQIRFEHVSASEGLELIERHRLADGVEKKGDRS